MSHLFGDVDVHWYLVSLQSFQWRQYLLFECSLWLLDLCFVWNCTWACGL